MRPPGSPARQDHNARAGRPVPVHTRLSPRTATPAGRCGAGVTAIGGDRMADLDGCCTRATVGDCSRRSRPPTRGWSPTTSRRRTGGPPDFPLPSEAEGFVVGVADDGAGVRAPVIEIGGTTRRPDGSTYHVTWSLADGREAVESNDAIRERGWAAAPQRHRIRLEPEVFAWD